MKNREGSTKGYLTMGVLKFYERVDTIDLSELSEEKEEQTNCLAIVRPF